MIVIETSKGAIQIELDTENTPKTAENFLNYVKEGFYENTIFHRVIDGFMIQGGGLDENMTQKATKKPVENEGSSSRQNLRGTISMARTSDPHSATAQFFINVVDNPFLNFRQKSADGYGYCVFGKVVAGMDIVDKIAKVRTGNQSGHADVPQETVLIHRVYEEN